MAEVQVWASRAALALSCLLLCVLYAADTLMVSATVHWYHHNPSSGQLMVLAELLKLAIAVALAVWSELQKASSSSSGIGGSDVLVTSKLQHVDAESLLPDIKAPQLPATPLQWVQQQLQRRGWFSAVLHFGLPAVCYCVSNNLSFYALQLLPAYTYMLLTSLKIIITALMRASFLSQAIPQHQQLSYVLMLVAVNLGTPGGAHAAASSAHVRYNIPAGVLIMLLVAACSALATVYTEWVMNHSCYNHESIHKQNAKLYLAGIALNGGYFLVHGAAAGRSGSSNSLWSPMRPLHWAIVLVLATMGLVVSAIIKYQGSGVKVMASAAAMFASAWASQVLLGDQPPLLFWLGAVFAAAALLWHHSGAAAAGYAQTAASSNSSSNGASGGGKCSHASHVSRSPVLLWAALVVFVGMAVLMSGGGNPVASSTAGKICDRSLGWHPTSPGSVSCAVQQQWLQARQPPAARNTSHPELSAFPRNSSLLIPTEWLPLDTLAVAEVCAPLHCFAIPECTIHNPKCCMFHNARLLSFTQHFLASHGLEHEWFAVYGSMMGAVRHPGGMLPWTDDVDLGASPRLVATLERPEVREEMWQYGFYFFLEGLWKICPHARHPDPLWQDVLLKPVFKAPMGEADSLYQPQGDDPRPPAYRLAHPPAISRWIIDLWPAARMIEVRNGTYFWCNPCPDPAAPTSQNLWYLWGSEGWVQVTFNRTAAIAGVRVAIPDNAEEHAAVTYGTHWRSPDHQYHGKWWRTQGGWAERTSLFSGSPEAFVQYNGTQERFGLQWRKRELLFPELRRSSRLQKLIRAVCPRCSSGRT